MVSPPKQHRPLALSTLAANTADLVTISAKAIVHAVDKVAVAVVPAVPADVQTSVAAKAIVAPAHAKAK